MNRDNITWFDITDSTNNEALKAMDTAPDKSVWAAKFQTAGRGQRGNKWESTKGENLMFTILFKPTFLKPQEQFIVSQIVALGVKSYLKQKGVDAKIKWPNDIYVGDEKICGILIEHSIMGDSLSASIIGIGINLNQKLFLSDALNPTSLSILTGDTYNVEAELNEVLAEIFNYYDIISKCDMESRGKIEEEYHNSLYRLNQYFEFEDCNSATRFRAKIVGVDRYACMILEDTNGDKKSYAFKEVKYIL